MIEPEIAFADLNDDIDLAEDYLKFLVHYALTYNDDDLELFEVRRRRRRRRREEPEEKR